MISNKKALLLLTTLLLSGSLGFAQTVFAETDAVKSDPTVCSGKITGVTRDYSSNVGTNINSGRITFNAHPDPVVAGAIDYSGNSYHSTNTSLVQAPATRGDAACVSKIGGKYPLVTGTDYDYMVKGWAWDNNGGFVSFNCTGGSNNAGGSNVPCGSFDYGVYIGAKDSGGVGYRSLFGYAWNPTFGYIKFHNDPSDVIKYGVKIDSSGAASGYAWTSAGIYIDFTGATFNLPDVAVVVTPPVWCSDKRNLCVEITPDPSNLNPSETLAFSSGKAVAFADGVEGYNMKLYFKDKDGNAVVPSNIANLANNIKFNWTDTVKWDQVKAGPYQVSDYGAVKNKPLTFNATDFKLVGDHYELNNLITSFAPTSDAKLSLTTSTKPPYLVNNESFISNPGLTLPTEPNKLTLDSITYPDLVDGTGNVLISKTSSPIYPNGKTGLAFKFRPAVYVSTLYANDYQDSILAYRSVPATVKRGVKKSPNLGSVSGNVDFHMTYSSTQTLADSTCSNTFNFTVYDALTGLPLPAGADVTISTAINLLVNNTFDLNITPDIPNADPVLSLPCKVASGATIYSIVSYGTPGGPVTYYDNKLPRIGGSSVINPAVVVHGNIIGQAVTSVQGGERVQTSGSVNINLIRDAINENLQKNTDQTALASKVVDDCTFTSMNDNNGTGVMGLGTCPSGQSSYYRFDVGSEHVLYSKGNVTLAFSNGSWNGKWVVISDGGNIFVDSNLYPTDSAATRISLIAFRSATPTKYYTTGNVYLHPDVTNIGKTLSGVTFVADGSLFSYDGDHTHIDFASNGTGEPRWADYSTMISTLKSQLLFWGAIYSSNTIGGANLDQATPPKRYLLAGGGKIINLPASLTDRMKAQYYDLNYLRMFKLDLQLGDTGLPIDQKCGKAWGPDDQVNLNLLNANPPQPLANGDTAICGSIGSCDPKGSPNQTNACDGINPLVKYDAQNTNGDLVIPANIITADGLDKTKDFNPEYVYLVVPDKNSFVFSKAGAINISGR